MHEAYSSESIIGACVVGFLEMTKLYISDYSPSVPGCKRGIRYKCMLPAGHASYNCYDRLSGHMPTAGLQINLYVSDSCK